MDLAESLRPEGCIHLAGMAFVPAADADPALAFQINTLGTLNLLSRISAPRAARARIWSSPVRMVYGTSRADTPIAEDQPL